MNGCARCAPDGANWKAFWDRLSRTVITFNDILQGELSQEDIIHGLGGQTNLFNGLHLAGISSSARFDQRDISSDTHLIDVTSGVFA